MFSSTDYDKLQQIMAESPEKKELLTKLLNSHQMTISSISHEIRNPLTLVYSTLQLIEAQHPEVTSYKYWNDLQQDIEYMKLLLEELSYLNNSNRLHLSEIDTSTFLKSLSLSFAASLVETKIEFISHVDSDLPWIKGDSLKLREVILNLLTNAKDAVISSSYGHNASSEHPVITLDAHIRGNMIEITVADNGCGISSDKLAHIFEPFVTYKENGTGLGLAIASQIARAHHGNLIATSIPGTKTTFTLTLPV